jgi:hypothetical protein
MAHAREKWRLTHIPLGRSTVQMNEGFARTIEVICKLIGVVALGSSALYAGYTYVSNAVRESKQPFLNQRLIVYLATNETTATIATTTDTKELVEAKATFWKFYWGKMGVSEDRGVQTAMENIADCLRRRCSQRDVRSLLPDLISATRTSIRSSWDVVLSPDPLKNLGNPDLEDIEKSQH